MSEDGFPQRLREPMQGGKLPDRPPDGTWGGPGSGAQCVICESPVTADEAELELEFGQANGSTALRYDVHARCFTAWTRRREDLLLAVPAESNGNGGVERPLQARPIIGNSSGRELGRRSKRAPV